MKEDESGDQVDEGRQRLHEVEQRPQHGVEPGPMGRGDADRHPDDDAGQRREPDERDRLDRGLPIAEIGDEEEGDDDEGRQAP